MVAVPKERFTIEEYIEFDKNSEERWEYFNGSIISMTGESDLRTPIRQSEEFYRALKMLKKDTLLVRMPDEYHGWRRPSHQLLQQLYLMAWFDKHSSKSKSAAVDAASSQK